MNDRFEKLLQLAANGNREIEYSVERVIVRVGGAGGGIVDSSAGNGEIAVAEAATVPITTPADLAGNQAASNAATGT